MQIAIALLTIVGLFGAYWLSEFRDAEGFITADYCLLISLATALLIASLAWHTPMRAAAAWFALFIFGQGVSLQLIEAGTTIHYQHYRLIHASGSIQDIVLASLLAMQTLAVIAGTRSRLKPITMWIAAHLGMMRLLVIVLAVIVLSVFPSRELHRFALELLISGVVVATQLACLLLGLMALPRGISSRWEAKVNGFVGGNMTRRASPSSTRIDRLAIICAVWTICISSALATFSYERHPHIPDEVAYLFQANYFADGQLGTPPPPVPEAIETYLIDCEAGSCVSPVPPGWPAILALGSLAGIDWLVNPLLAGLNVILLFLLLRKLYDRYTARLGILLVSAAPWYLLMSMNFMTHTFSLTCALAAALSVVQMHRRQQSIWGIPGGIAIGLLSLTRPLDGLMVATVLGLAALCIPGQRFRLAPVTVLGLASLAVGATVLLYNAALNGNPFTFPIMAYTDRILGPGINSLGFGPEKGTFWGGLDPFPGHGLPDVLLNAYLNLAAMNIEMFGWSIGSLLPLLLMVTSRSDSHLEPVDRWMFLFIFVIFCFQSLYWFSGGPDFGARYYYLVVIPLTALTVQALKFLGQTVSTGTASASRIPVVVLTGVLVLCVSALTNFLPWRAIDKYHHYRGMRPDIRTLITKEDFGNALLLIRGAKHPDWNSAVVYSSLDQYGANPLIVWDKNPEVRQSILAAYPDRKVWLIDGPSRTGAGYRIIAGPLESAELIR